MSAEREVLRRLIQGLPEKEVPAILGAVRSSLHAATSRAWPPAWFDAARGQTSDAAAQFEELLQDRFGQA
jgi:hypothetical protein